MPRARRIFHHYQELEETEAGFWRMVSGQELKDNIEKAADLLRSPQELIEAMRQAVKEWKKSCEAAFTTDSLNQIAFLGQAACCVAVGVPCGCTRIAWHDLTQPEKDEANLAAQIVLHEWALGYHMPNQLELFQC